MVHTINKILSDIAKQRNLTVQNDKLEELKKQKQDELNSNIKHSIDNRYRYKLNLMYSKIPERDLNKKFSDLVQSEDNKQAIRSAYRFAEEVELIDKGLYLYGGVGVGKTTILAITAQLIAEYKQKLIYFASEEDILTEIKNAYSKDSEVSDTDIIRAIAENDVIFIDELGQNGTDWALRNIKRILDECMNRSKLICFSSNYSPKELIARWGGNSINKVPEQVVDRILEACQIERISGDSFRK